MSIVGDIFDELWNKRFYYKGIPVNFFGIPRFRRYNHNSLKTTLSQLKRHRFIEKDERGWSFTRRGRDRMKTAYVFFKKFVSPFEKNSPRNLLFMFDVPHEKRQHRDWLRRQLREYDYIMVQKSVWVGPSPLPEEFRDYIKTIKIKGCIKTFRLAKGYNGDRS